MSTKRSKMVAAATSAAAILLLSACGNYEPSGSPRERANVWNLNQSSSVADSLEGKASSLKEQVEREDAYEDAAQKAKEAKNEAKEERERREVRSGGDPVSTRNDPEPVGGRLTGPEAYAAIVNWAQSKVGTPYVWGGESEEEGGFDCSGLTQVGYAQAGYRIPRVAQDQYRASNVHPKRKDLIIGDLVFYGTSSNLHHVAIYIGSNMILHAPKPGAKIRFNTIEEAGSDYYGATRVIQAQ